MLPESNAAASSSPSPGSPSIKRTRDPEDEVYVDNLRSHKRYLSEIMASSLNGLTVGDHHLSENFMDSSLRPESIPYVRDDISVPYSPMSEDSDESRYNECSTYTCPSQPESVPTSPVSPHRCQKPVVGSTSASGPPPTTSHPSHSGFITPVGSPQARHRSSDTEGRFPSSPSDICHSADLRRAALMRSVQMRTQPIGASQFELLLSPSTNNIEGEERQCPYMKIDADDRCYQIDECTELSVSDPENDDKSLTENLKEGIPKVNEDGTDGGLFIPP